MSDRFRRMYDMAKKELFENILPFWMRHSVDREFGGFYGAALRDGTPVPHASKCVVLNARLLWTFATAYSMFGDRAYLQLAGRACDYFTERFIDSDYGGSYFMLTYDGKPEDAEKMVYGQAFSIYALAGYFRASGDRHALDNAMRIFELLELHAYDPVFGGYFELFDRTWTQCLKQRRTGINEAPDSTKTMNTHLHMLEAYAALLRAWPERRIRAKVAESLELMRDRIVDRGTGHYRMFFRDDWAPVSRTVSFGHDIEGSWLMTEACEAMGNNGEALKTAPICAEMARSCLNESIAADGSMQNEYDPDTGRTDRKRIWWVQAEAVVGFLNAWQMTGEERFLEASLNTFEYIDRCFVDHVHGDWFALVGEDGVPVEKGSGMQKIGAWKANYHNARMCFEIIRRFEANRSGDSN